MRLGISLSLVTLAWALGAGTAQAHVLPAPTFVHSGEQQTITLAGENERRERMNGLSVTVPAGVTILGASESGRGWPATVGEDEASWTGCCLAPGSIGSFALELVADGEPRSVTLDVRQLYPDGRSVRWPVALAVLPAPQPSGSLATTLAVGAVGLVVTLGVVGLAWLRRSRPSPE